MSPLPRLKHPCKFPRAARGRRRRRGRCRRQRISIALLFRGSLLEHHRKLARPADSRFLGWRHRRRTQNRNLPCPGTREFRRVRGASRMLLSFQPIAQVQIRRRFGHHIRDAFVIAHLQQFTQGFRRKRAQPGQQRLVFRRSCRPSRGVPPPRVRWQSAARESSWSLPPEADRSIRISDKSPLRRPAIHMLA